ncbi:hypothetical protein C8R45DRAFT_955072 [Mycena sanguinolenta]|nr:hypothetical protein C8R45DRAFT_955072 [Mycena sanguinolenta]
MAPYTLDRRFGNENHFCRLRSRAVLSFPCNLPRHVALFIFTSIISSRSQSFAPFLQPFVLRAITVTVLFASLQFHFIQHHLSMLSRIRSLSLYSIRLPGCMLPRIPCLLWAVQSQPHHFVPRLFHYKRCSSVRLRAQTKLLFMPHHPTRRVTRLNRRSFYFPRPTNHAHCSVTTPTNRFNPINSFPRFSLFSPGLALHIPHFRLADIPTNPKF